MENPTPIPELENTLFGWLVCVGGPTRASPSFPSGRAAGDCARMPIPLGEESTLVLTMCCVNARGGARSAV